MNKWWNSLAPREKWIALVGGTFIVLMFYYFALLTPLEEKIAQSKQNIKNKAELVAWMQQAQKLVKNATIKSNPTSNQPLLVQAEQSIKRARLGDQALEIRQLNQTQVMVKFSKVSFTSLVEWLNQLLASSSVSINKANLRRTDVEGIVSADVVLER